MPYTKHAVNFTTVIGSAPYISALTRMISKKAHMPSSYIQYSVMKDSVCLAHMGAGTTQDKYTFKGIKRFEHKKYKQTTAITIDKYKSCVENHD